MACEPYSDIHKATEEDLKLKRDDEAIPAYLVISEEEKLYTSKEEAHTTIPGYLMDKYNANQFSDQKVMEVEYTLLTQRLSPKLYLNDGDYTLTGNEYCKEEEGWLVSEEAATAEITLEAADYSFVGYRYPNFSASDYEEGEYQGYTYDSRLVAMVSDILENHRSYDRSKVVEVIFAVYDKGEVEADTMAFEAGKIQGCAYHFLPADDVEAKVGQILNHHNQDERESSQIAVSYKVGEIGDVSTEEAFFQKGEAGAWAVIEEGDLTQEYYTLTGEDYEAFGFNYPNFSSSVPQENYLPRFLNAKYPYAQSGDNLRISYDYYGGGETKDYLVEYEFDGEVWMQLAPYAENLSSVDKFKYLHSETAWVVSLAQVIKLEKADYELTGDDKYGNFGYYDNKEGEYPEGVAVDNIIDAKINHILNMHYEDLKKDGQEVIVFYMYYDNGTNEVSRSYIYEAATEAFIKQ
ncbi:hypothetical protein PEDI_26620 [Persicobacter diffluens]|uniref:Uncharacterized protein n=2 Tax=Persicobacter diffluens TaxID=981 RepID=A0AAN5AJW6_9BACT|nr:hypothetical protein PEDI_26620 [Persicobacter diffluens]